MDDIQLSGIIQSGRFHCPTTGSIAMEYDFQRIASMLSPSGKFRAERIFFFDEVDSTNAWMLRQQEVDGLCCIANHQVAGKGSRGKTWTDAPGGSILMSMGWEVDVDRCCGVSLVAGLAVIGALKETGVGGIRLKWPNDILADGRKLGGILVEKSGSKLVVGLGLNVNLQQPSMHGVDQPWTDLSSIGAGCDGDVLVSRLLRNMGDMITDCVTGGFAGYAESWNAADAFAGLPVQVLSGREAISGIERGVDRTGALRIESDAGIRTVHAGDVSLRRMEPFRE